MATENKYTGNNSTTNYAFTFPYLKEADVKCSLDGTLTTAFSFANATTIAFDSAPGNNVEIRIYRVTDTATPKATYFPGSAIKSEDLNDNQLQVLYTTEEVQERSLQLGGIIDGDLTFGTSHKIIFEGATADAHETTLTVTDPTADRTITIPNVTGTVVTTGDTGTVTATMLAANSVDSSELVNGSIDTAHLSDDAVTTAKLATDAVGTDALADNAVDTAAIVDAAVTTAKIGNNQVTTDKIPDGHITLGKLASNSVDGGKIVADSITAAKIADNAVDSEHYVDGSIDTAHIANSQITNAKIAADAITTSNIQDGQISTAKIADSAINVDKIANNAINADKIAANAVDTSEIKDDAVTNAKIGDAAVNRDQLATDAIITAKITDANITTAKIADDAVTAAKIADGAITSAHIAADTVVAADIAANAVGASELADDAVDTAAIADAAVTTAKIGNNQVTTDKIPDGHITLNKLASNSVDGGKIVDGAVITAKVADAGVTTAKIADDAVTLAKMAGIARGKIIYGDASGNPAVLAIGTNGQVLKSDGTDIEWGDDSTSGASSSFTVADESSDTTCFPVFVTAATGDLSPKSDSQLTYNSSSGALGATTLGGTLSTAAQTNVTSTGTLTGLTVSGDVSFDNGADAGKDILWDVSEDHLLFSDNVYAKWGNGGDLQIYHDGSNSHINDQGSGVIYLRSNNLQINNAANNEAMINAAENGSVELYYDNSKKIETTSDGVTVTGDINVGAGEYYASDNGKIRLGSSQDLEIYHDATDSWVKNWTGKLNLTATSSESGIIINPNGAVELYYDSVLQTKTTSTGLHLADSKRIDFGTDSDLKIYHDNSHAYVTNSTGYLKFRLDNYSFENADGSELYAQFLHDGEATLYYDGSKKFETTSGGCMVTGQLNFAAAADPNISLRDNGYIAFGNADDFKIWSDGDNGILKALTGDLYLQSDTAIKFTKEGNAETLAVFDPDGSCDLYYDNAKKLETISTGVNITGGIRLGGNNAVNELDDYEEGTWTPALGGSGNSFTYHANTGGVYTKVGRMVYASGFIQLSARSGTSQLVLTGLPFAAGDHSTGSSTIEGGVHTQRVDNSSSGTSGPMGTIASSQSEASLWHTISSGNGSALNADEIDTTFVWGFTVMYPA
jgi:hypothetical protein